MHVGHYEIVTLLPRARTNSLMVFTHLGPLHWKLHKRLDGAHRTHILHSPRRPLLQMQSPVPSAADLVYHNLIPSDFISILDSITVSHGLKRKRASEACLFDQ